MRAHDRDNLGVTRRVLPSRLWSGKTVDQHKADRAEVVRETLLSAGMDDLDLDRMAATRHPARRDAPVRLDRHPARPRHLRPHRPRLHRRTATLARAVRARQDRCGSLVAGVSTVAQPP